MAVKTSLVYFHAGRAHVITRALKNCCNFLKILFIYFYKYAKHSTYLDSKVLPG